MSWFHVHKWQLVGKTYAERQDVLRSIKNASDETFQQLLKLQLGCTTYLWKCEVEGCDEFMKQECLGKEV